MNNSKELPTYENYLLGWNLMVDFIENNRDLEAIYSPNLEEIASQIGMILQKEQIKNG
tara:strand:+ start:535 stop:708 length:174 start_codon:yes stop_codon:yes gene_type:complete